MAAADLISLSRDELVSRATELGIERPNALTKAELVDEILKRSAPTSRRASMRGWLGAARDLVARVVDKGLHLPEAAQIIRSSSRPPLPTPPAPLATATLAEIYAAQGYLDKALRVLDEVLDRQPDHAEARTLRVRLEAQLHGAAGERPAEARPDEPAGELRVAPAPVSLEQTLESAPSPAVEAPVASPAIASDDGAAPLPRHYDVDELVALATDPRTAFVYWELSPRRYARTRARDPEGQLVVRVLCVAVGGAAARATSYDVPVDNLVGDRFIRGLAPDSELRLCLGWAGASGFVPLVVADDLTMPHDYAERSSAATRDSWPGAADPAPGGGSRSPRESSKGGVRAGERLRGYAKQPGGPHPAVVDMTGGGYAVPWTSASVPGLHGVAAGGASEQFRPALGGASEQFRAQLGGASEQFRPALGGTPAPSDTP
jgi:hypothetical protein